MSDVECPYCGAEQEICHDDGFGYEEDRLHEMECCECEKTFVFTTSILFMYEPSKADCLNDGEHQFKPTGTVPRKYTRMRCSECGLERPCTDSEMSEVLGS